MPWNAKIFDIFLSCPSDVIRERDLVIRIVQDWNLTRGRSRGVFFSVLTWENLVSSKISDRPQNVINQKIGDAYDIYLGMMWGRFGNPTGVSNSGTVEEFDRALDRYRSGDQVRLAMLFKTSDISFRDIDGDQIRQVQEFKKRYSDQGGLYREYDSDESLIRLVNALVEDFLESPIESLPEIYNHGASNQVNSEKTLSLDDPDEELGIFDINEQITPVVDRQIRFLNNLSEISNENTKLTAEASDKISSLASIGQATQENIQAITSKLADKMDSLSSFVESNVKSFVEDNESMAMLTEAGLDISRDFSGQSREEFIEAVKSAATIMLENADSNLSLIRTLESSPRTDKKMNKARRRLIRNLNIIESSTRNSGNKIYLALKNFG